MARFLPVMFAATVGFVFTITNEGGVDAYTCFLHYEPDPDMNYRWTIHERDVCGCTTLRMGTRFRHPQECIKHRSGIEQWNQCDQGIRRWAPFVDCQALFNFDVRTNGEYTIFPKQMPGGVRVFCDMDAAGGWVVFQRRESGLVNFTRSWNDYLGGFGDLAGEFWWGLRNLRTLTGNRDDPAYWDMAVTVEDWDDLSGTVLYYGFAVLDDTYSIFVGDSYKAAGQMFIGDSLSFGVYHNGQAFSTWDRDQDADLIPGENCAASLGSGWWYGSCWTVRSDLNGRYLVPPASTAVGGVSWDSWKTSYSFKYSEMKMRRGN